MEHFFVDENYYDNIEDYIHDMGDGGDEEWVKSLSDTWEQKIEFAQLEKLITVNDNLIDEISEFLIDANTERFPEDPDRICGKLNTALKESIDIDKLHLLMPEMWYPNDKFGKLTKQDLLDAL
ncbi:MAG: hypothetical protein A2Z57_11220 [Planctomycetes bacterium RIFCSPHIGHO2_12_39_6]|nr:MAG: hypothetical protein A2Z57_11220 [Planctomycetes bacterium RIFCSPHIGHO2_12_39_6]